MKMIGNLLWHIPCCGFLLAGACFLVGTILTLMVWAAPVGLGLMEYGKFLTAPFSYRMISKDDWKAMRGETTNTVIGAYSAVVSLVYVILFGWWLAIGAALMSFLLCCTVIGIPCAMVVLSSIPVLLSPVGKMCVDELEATAMETAKMNRMMAGGMPRY